MNSSFFLPESLPDLWQITSKHPDAVFMAGGTDLLVSLRAKGVEIPSIICLEKIIELQTIKETDGIIRIGAATTLTSLLESEIISRKLPVLHSAVCELGSPLIRNMGTIGGNICTGSPAGDTLPPLYVLQAELLLKSATNERTVSIDSFITAPGQTTLQDGEILDSICISVPKQFNVHHFEKVGQRKALAISVVSFAALLHTEENIVQNARFAWGSVGPTIVRSHDAEAAVVGKALTLTTLNTAAEIARLTITPISDIRSTSEYRKQVAGNLLLRLATI